MVNTQNRARAQAELFKEKKKKLSEMHRAYTLSVVYQSAVSVCLSLTEEVQQYSRLRVVQCQKQVENTKESVKIC